MPKKLDVDWGQIETLYRLGQMSAQEISRKYKMAPSTLSRKAKKEKWERDYSKEVLRRTKAAMMANPEGEKGDPFVDPNIIVEQAVKKNVEVLREHIEAMRDGRGLAKRMFHELDVTTTHRGQLLAMLENFEDGDINDEKISVLKRAVSLPKRASTLNNLIHTIVKAIDAERKALNLDEERPDTDGFTQFYNEVTDRSEQRVVDKIKKRIDETTLK